MKRAPLQSRKGTVLLVALCFVTVLGISLAGYIAVCSRTMQVSNRTFQTGLSQQLAEMGLEEALRAFNKNDWSDWSNGVSADWTVSGTTATCNLTFPAGKFGQGVTGSVKIRVDNYNAAVMGAAWSSTKSYRIGDQVGYNGLWYSCVVNNSNQAPTANNFTYWVPTQVPWKWSTRTYKAEDMVNHNGTWYRSLSTHSNHEPPNATYWQSIPSVSFYPSIDYTTDAILHWTGNVWYQKTSASWNAAPSISWRYRTGYNYSFDDLVYYNAVWYRYINSTPTPSITPGSNASYWENALSGSVHGWSSGSINYNLNDVVYYSGTSQWYRCILAHTSSGSLTPTNSAYWSNTPRLSQHWNSETQYSQNDTVYFNGVWYLSIANSNVGNPPPLLPATNSWWVGADTSTGYFQWNRSTAYNANEYKCYGGVWYRCLVANTGQSPNNTTYWTAAWTQSSGVATGATVVYAEGTINIAGSGSTKTQLRATIAPAPLFPNAAGATSNLTISSGTGTVDSYNSTIESYSSGIAGSSAVLAAGTTLAINGTTAIKGYLAWPSPPAGISTGTTINGQTLSTDKSRVSRSPYIPQFSPLPTQGLSSAFSSGNLPSGRLLATSSVGTVTIGTPGAASPARYYFNASLDIASSGYDIGTLRIIGPVILHIDGNLRTRNGGTIDIATTGSAEIHIDGSLRVDETSNGFINRTLDPKKLVLISDVSGTNTQYYDDTTNPFYGVVYVPFTTTTLGFDIATGVSFHGAVSAKNITFSSEATVHYDTSLRYATTPGVEQPYAITDWRELDGTERITMP